MKKTIKITFAKDSETNVIIIKNNDSNLGYSLNYDLGISNSGIIVINGFQTDTKDKLFVIGSDYYFENNGNTNNRNLSINDVDGEIIIQNKANGILSNDITTFSIFIELEVETIYTSLELSKIYHALSVLESGNTDNLRDVADALRVYVGAPPPKPRP